MNRRGLFLTFEGTEGCGKTTQLRALHSYLENLGFDVVSTREPGGSSIGESIRTILLSETYNPAPATELLLYGAERAQHVKEVIEPALKARKWVLCDRYGDATRAYQCFGRGLARENVERVQALSTGGLEPDLTLLFLLPVEEGLKRARERNGASPFAEGRFEAEAIAFHRRVAEGYALLAEEFPERIVTIDATGSREDVFGRVLKVLEARFELS